MARRKRGSFLTKQAPLSAKQRTRRLYAWAGATLGILLLIILGAWLFLLSWLQGGGFRLYLTQRLAEATQAREVSIPENLSISGSHVTLPECTLHGVGPLQSLGIRKLHLEVNRNALLSRELKLQQCSVEEMQINLGLTSDRPTVKPTLQVSAPKAPLPIGGIPLHSGFLKSAQVRSFESHYTDTTITLGEQEPCAFSLSGYHLMAVPRPEEGAGAWAIGIENGRIRTPFSWLSESGVKNATLLYREQEIQLTDCRVLLTPGSLRAKGIYMLSSGLWKARVDIQRANVARILNDDWKKRLTGELNGYLDLSGEAGRAWSANGKISLDKGQLEGLPILSDLQLNGTTPYRTLSLEKAECQLTFPYSEPEHGISHAWLWDHIDIRSADGRFLVRGRIITGQDGSLSGSLNIGLPAQLVADIGLSQSPLIQKLFNAPVEVPGYVWVHVNLSGTVDAPQEDLSVRLATVLPESLPGMATQAVKSLHPMLGSFLPPDMVPEVQEEEEETTAPDAGSKKPSQKATEPENKVRNIIKSGLDMIF